MDSCHAGRVTLPRRGLAQTGDHAVGNAVRHIVAHQLVQERKSEEDCRAWGLASYHLAVCDNRHAGGLPSKVRHARWIAGDMLVLEDASRSKHGRRRAYSAHEAPFLLLAAQPLEKRLAKTKISRAFSAAR